MGSAGSRLAETWSVATLNSTRLHAHNVLEMLILGLGAGTYPISPATRKHINALGIRVDIQDTRNAAAQFNLLATERGVGNIAAALIPIGWKAR